MKSSPMNLGQIMSMNASTKATAISSPTKSAHSTESTIEP